MIGGLRCGKTPGANDLPMEFYSQFSDPLAPKLTAFFADPSSLDLLLMSMEEAVIVLIPKPLDCASYQSTSLLSIDAKIFSKILASRLSTVIEKLIHVDQKGFTPGKGTDILVVKWCTTVGAI